MRESWERLAEQFKEVHESQNKFMKAIITSNSRPSRRGICALLLGIAALWAMPRNAHAQLYVAVYNSDAVGKYNTTTGAVINANFITGLYRPTGLAVSGNNLFVTSVGGPGSYSGKVGKYDATTGAVINANFIAGLNNPTGLAVGGNNLFVSISTATGADNAGSVGRYNAITGAVINANFITGLSTPEGLAVVGPVSGSPVSQPVVTTYLQGGQRCLYHGS
jgi:hypothetical protein